MKHLLSYSVYQDPLDLGDDIGVTLDRMSCDGLELLTSYDLPSPDWAQHTVTVHLPYATDWLAGWEGRPYDVDEGMTRFLTFGRDKDEVIGHIRKAMECASVLNPEYGVMHACNADVTELIEREYTRSDRYVISRFCEMMNSVVSTMQGGAPPFTLAFENLWWPGMRLVNASDYKEMERRLEFDDWCICLDTGHMMNCLPGICTEDEGIDAVLQVLDKYDSTILDRIRGVHLHYSASYGYRSSFIEHSLDDDIMRFIESAYNHVSLIDQHMPFSSDRCNEILDILRPDVVVHELPGSKTDMISDFRQQRSLMR